MKYPMKLVLGGLRVGDTFHAVPFLHKASEQYDIIWHHGSYAGKAAELLATCSTNLNIVQTIQSNDTPQGRIPTDMESIFTFRKQTMNAELLKGLNGCVLESNPGIITSANPSLMGCPDIVTQTVRANRSRDSIIHLKDEGNYRELWGDYIAVQPQTISSWKVLPTIYNVKYPLPIVCLGALGERLIPGAKDGREDGFTETIKILKGARCVVAQHSAMACLAFYLNVPLITLHFHKEGLFAFANFHDNCRDLRSHDPNYIKDFIRVLMDSTWEETNG